jgi:hypothetical protein
MLWNDWASVLKLLCMLQMANIWERAVNEITKSRLSANDQKDLLMLSTKLGITEIRDRAIQAFSGAIQPVKWVQLGI